MRFYFLIFVSLLLPNLAFGQCVRAAKLKVPAILGQVFYIDRDGNKDMVAPEARVRLWKQQHEDELIFDLKTDSKGMFAVDNLPRGKYIMSIDGLPMFDNMIFSVQILKKTKSNANDLIVVGLGATELTTTDSCAGFARVRSIRTLTK